jgi:hypothetical protein
VPPIGIMCICYGCLLPLPYHGRPRELRAAPACAGFIITLLERPASASCLDAFIYEPYLTIVSNQYSLPYAVVCLCLCLCLCPMDMAEACRRTWPMAEACTAKPSGRNIRRPAPIIALYHHPEPYAVIQSHCEIAHSVRLVELYT